ADSACEFTRLSSSNLDRPALRMGYGPQLLSLTVEGQRRQRFYRSYLDFKMFVLTALSSKEKYQELSQKKHLLETYLLQFELALADGYDPLSKPTSAL
ncbi:MAG: hypothetical protein B7X06_03420, partial [Verrucomicrobia bacterium 21-51-4]